METTPTKRPAMLAPLAPIRPHRTVEFDVTMSRTMRGVMENVLYEPMRRSKFKEETYGYVLSGDTVFFVHVAHRTPKYVVVHTAQQANEMLNVGGAKQALATDRVRTYRRKISQPRKPKRREVAALTDEFTLDVSDICEM